MGLVEGMKKLPENLKHLNLCLSFNNLEQDPENMKLLGEGMK